MFRFSLAFVFGVLVLQQHRALPDPLWCIAALVAGVLLLRWRRGKSAAAFLAGWGWALLFAALSAPTPLPPEFAGRDVVITGVVSGLASRFERGQRFAFEMDRLTGERVQWPPQRIRLSWYSPAVVVHPGDRLELMVRLKAPRGTRNPGGFDYERWLYARGYAATGYVRHGRVLETGGATALLHRLRESITTRLDSTLAGRPMLGVIRALVTGQRDRITRDQWRIFRNTGTVHLVAISGLHIGLLAAAGYFLGRALWLRTGSQAVATVYPAAVMSVLMAGIYAALAGFSVPTQRALIMVIAVILAMFAGRRPAPFHGLGLALVIIVCLHPMSVLDAGFWLSFAAVSLILYLFAGRLARGGKFSAAQKVNLVTAAGLTPLLLLYFNQVSWIAPLANLLAVPLMSLLLIPMSLIGTAMLWICAPAGRVLLVAAESLMQALWQILSALCENVSGVFSLPAPGPVSLGLAVAGVLLLFAPRGIPCRWLGMVLLLPLLHPVPDRPAPGAVRFTLLDVGQGLAAVAETRRHTLVFDTGARFSAKFDMGASVVVPYLRQRGIDRIDAVVVSHGDNDHIGGFASLASEMRIERVYSSVPGHLHTVNAIPCRNGQSWRWDGVVFQMLGPLRAYPQSGNNTSCVLRVVSDGGRILLTGDIEAAAERSLQHTLGKALASEYLVVAHHGSNTSSTADFLRAVAPRYALIPAGYRNRYGFPSTKVLARLRAAGAEIFNTARLGAITITAGPETPLPVPAGYRPDWRRYYHAAVLDRAD